MAEPDVTLRFEIAKGQVPDAENVVRALAAYIEILKTAGAVVAPGSRMEVGLAGVEDGSDVFKFILRHCENFAEHLTGGMSEFPLVSRAAITLGCLIGGTVLVIGLENALSTSPSIPAEQMEVFKENNRLLKESNDLQQREMEFYGILQEEPAYEAIEIIRPYDSAGGYRVPREQFASRSGLWMAQDDAMSDPSSQTRTATWDVVLIKPVLVGTPRRWRFARDGIEFSALMKDEALLQAIHDQTLSVKLAEGIKMRLEVKYRETYEGGSWLPVAGSHRVTRVIDPLPPSVVVPLFPGPGSPKK